MGEAKGGRGGGGFFFLLLIVTVKQLNPGQGCMEISRTPALNCHGSADFEE